MSHPVSCEPTPVSRVVKHGLFDGLKVNKPRPCGITERLAQHAETLGYGDAAKELRAVETDRRAAAAAAAKALRENEELASRRLSLVRSAAALGQRRWGVGATDDSLSTASGASSVSGISNASGLTVVRVGRRSKARSRANDATVVSSTSSQASRSRSRSSKEWFVASAGPYADAYDEQKRRERDAKTKFMTSSGFVTSFGKRSAMPLRTEGVVAASGAYHGASGRYDHQRKNDAAFSRVEDVTRRPKQATRAWMSIPDRKAPGNAFR